MLQKEVTTQFDCSNHLYSQTTRSLNHYTNGVQNGYCIEVNIGHSYGIDIAEGYYENGKRNGWGRNRQNDIKYLYGFHVTEEGEYLNGCYIDYMPDETIKVSDIIDIHVGYGYITYLTKDNSLYVSGRFKAKFVENYYKTIWKNVPIKVMTDTGKYFDDGDNWFKLTADNTLYTNHRELNHRKPENDLVYLGNQIIDADLQCYLKEDGSLCNHKGLKLIDGVSKFSGDEEKLILKKDGSVWYLELKYDNEEEYIGIPIKIMTDCKDIQNTYRDNFAIKNDNTLWRWGHTYSRLLAEGNITEASSKKPTLLFEDVVQVNILRNSGYMIKTDGGLYQWKWDETTQDGYVITAPPLKVMDDTSRIFGNGEDCIAIIKKDSSIWTLGENQYTCTESPTSSSDASNFVEVKDFYQFSS